MAVAVHHDGKAITRRIIDEILTGYCSVLLQPVQCEPLESLSKLVINLRPCSPKIGCREWIGKHAVGIRDIRLVQLVVKSLTAGWLSNSRDAAAVTLFSFAIAANVIKRFRSIWRNFSRRMAIINIMHEPHAIVVPSLSVYVISRRGDFKLSSQIVGDWTGGGGASVIAMSQCRSRLKQP